MRRRASRTIASMRGSRLRSLRRTCARRAARDERADRRERAAHRDARAERGHAGEPGPGAARRRRRDRAAANASAPTRCSRRSRRAIRSSPITPICCGCGCASTPGDNAGAIALEPAWAQREGPLRASFYTLLGRAHLAASDEERARAAFDFALLGTRDRSRRADLELAIARSYLRSGSREKAADRLLTIWTRDADLAQADTADELLAELEEQLGTSAARVARRTAAARAIGCSRATTTRRRWPPTTARSRSGSAEERAHARAPPARRDALPAAPLSRGGRGVSRAARERGARDPARALGRALGPRRRGRGRARAARPRAARRACDRERSISPPCSGTARASASGQGACSRR